MPRKNIQGTESVASGVNPAAAAPAMKHRAPRVTMRTPVREVSTAEFSGQDAPALSARQPSREEIARLAYSYWEARGYQGGSPEEDWLRAERELLSGAAIPE